MAEGTSSTGDMASALQAALSPSGGSGSSPSTPSSTPATPSAPAAASPSAPSSAAPTGTAPTTPAEPDLHKEFPDGRIPLTRHQEILQTTRQKQLEAARKEVLDELGPWNRLRAQFTPGEFEQIVEGLQEFHRNPHAWMRRIAPELGYQLYAAGQFPGQTPAPQHAQVSPVPEMPGPDLQFRGEDGQIYTTYSADQTRKLQQWHAQQHEQKVQSMLDPWIKWQQERARQQILVQVEQKAKADIEALKKEEGFEELRPHILAMMQADKRHTPESAYRIAYREHYIPVRDQRVIEKHDKELAQRAAAAGTPVSPTTRPAAAAGPASADQKKPFRQQVVDKLAELWPRSA